MSDKIVFRKGLLENLEDLPIAAPGFITNPGEERLVIGGANGNVLLPNAKDINEINLSLNASVKNDVQYGNAVKDLNNISNTGYYYYPDNYITDRNGCPDDFGGVVEHITITENKYAFQEASSLSGKKYQRLKLNGVWKEWKEILISEYENIELLNGWSLVDGSLECVKNGKIVSLNLSIKSGVINSQGSTQIITLPFPSKRTILYTTGNGSLTNINLTVSGNQLHVWGLTSAIERLPLNISYPVN